MQNKLIVSALPLDIRWADKEANFTALDSALRQLPAGTDVLVLPELFSTGYINDPSLLYETAELNTGETIDKIKERAAAFNTAIAGSFLARTAHRCYNRNFLRQASPFLPQRRSQSHGAWYRQTADCQIPRVEHSADNML